MIRNAQVSHVEDDNYENTRIINLCGLQLTALPVTGIALGEIRRIENGNLVYRHPVSGIVTVVNEFGVAGGGGGGGSVIAGAGLTKTDDTLEIISDNPGIIINADSIALNIQTEAGLEIDEFGLKTNYIYFELNGSTDETVTHNFGRIANVKVYENNEEIEAFISYPAGHETNKVRIQSNQSITGYAIIT